MRPWILVAVSALACTSCTTASLNRHSLAQTETVTDLRYREVLDNLAMIAQNYSALPAYSSIFTGTAQITDNAQITSTTIWNVVGALASKTSGFFSEGANPQATRTTLENWTLDPIVIPEKLEAMRCACRWVVYGPDRTGDDTGLLPSPDQARTPGRHFGVADRLGRLPAGWLGVGALKDVPLNACCKAHCGHTWVWVTRDGLGALSDFALVLQNIARVDANSPSLFYPQPIPLPFTFATLPTRYPTGNLATVTAIVSLDPWMNLAPDTPYIRYRVENLGSDSHLRSQINAAGGTLR